MKKGQLGYKPVGIILTLPVAFFKDRHTSCGDFKPLFERHMAKDDSVWNFKLTNLPIIQDLAYVYIGFDGKIQYRVNFVECERNVTKVFKDAPDGQERIFFDCNWVILSGPAMKAPKEIPFKGCQGFRYTDFIF